MDSSVNELILAPIHCLEPNKFRHKYSQLTDIEAIHVTNTILANKLAPLFLAYIRDNKLQNLFKSEQLNKIIFQAKRYSFHSLETVKEIYFLNKIFSKNDLKPLYLKGSALMHEYKNILLRPVVDIDILFKKDDLFFAYNLLEKHNFKQIDQNFPIEVTPNNKKILKETHHLPPLHRDTNIMIELHHRITLPKDFSICPLSDKFFEETKHIKFKKLDIQTLSNENLIIHQLIHFSLNTKFKMLLRTFADVKVLQESHEINWEEIFLKYKEEKIRRALSLALEVINFNTPITKNLPLLREQFSNFFPPRDLVVKAYLKSFRIEKPVMNENIMLELSKKPHSFATFKIIMKRIFLTKKELVRAYEILNINFFSLSYYYFINFFTKISIHGATVINLLLKKKKSVSGFEPLEEIENWVNKSTR